MTVEKSKIEVQQQDFLQRYLMTLSSIERLHRLMLDLIKDHFEVMDMIEINPVQALLIFNIGDKMLTAGELKTRGYYQGSNVSYNLKRLVELGYMNHKKCDVDRRSVRVSLTDKGIKIRDLLIELFGGHASEFCRTARLTHEELHDVNVTLNTIEDLWRRKIRYIY